MLFKFFKEKYVEENSELGRGRIKKTQQRDTRDEINTMVGKKSQEWELLLRQNKL